MFMKRYQIFALLQLAEVSIEIIYHAFVINT